MEFDIKSGRESGVEIHYVRILSLRRDFCMKLQYKHIVAIIYTVVLFLDRLDLTIVNVTLPTVAHHFQVSITSTDWISMAFLLALAISIPVSSWLGDRFGLKKSYLIAIALFGLGSGLCAWAGSLFAINILRFIQGLGGGMLIPIGMTMLYRIYDKSEYAHITSLTFLPSLIASAIAPFLGGVLLDWFGWRFVFLFSGPICLALFVYAYFILKEEEFRSHKTFDWGGFILISFILMIIFYGLSVIGNKGFSLESLIGLSITLLLIKLFVIYEKKQKFPLINLEFFKIDSFVQANYIQICFQMCHFGSIFLVGMYLQVGIGMSASMAGLVMGMQAIGAMLTIRYSIRLFNTYGPELPIIIGLLGVAILSPCILLIQRPSMVVFGMCLLFLRGIFSGLCGTPIQTLSVMDASKEIMGQINSIFNACRQVAISLGVALSSILISIGLKLNGVSGNAVIGGAEAVKVFGLSFFAIPLIALIGIKVVRGINVITLYW